MAVFVASPFGAALRGTRDQARRMSALGHDVWLIRWITFVYSGFWGAVSGLLFVYYNKYIHPASLSITASAEGLLAVIAGGSATLAGPIVGAVIVMILKNYVSAYIERWNMLLGFVFVVIVIFVPEGVVPEAARARSPGARPHLPDHHAFSQGLARAQPGAVLARIVEVALGCVQAARPPRRTERGVAARPETHGPGASRQAVDRRSIL